MTLFVPYSGMEGFIYKALQENEMTNDTKSPWITLRNLMGFCKPSSCIILWLSAQGNLGKISIKQLLRKQMLHFSFTTYLWYHFIMLDGYILHWSQDFEVLLVYYLLFINNILKTNYFIRSVTISFLKCRKLYFLPPYQYTVLCIC